MKKINNVGVVGMTGLVGRHVHKLLEVLHTPIKRLVPFGHSAIGSTIMTFWSEEKKLSIDVNNFLNLDVVMHCAGGDVSRELIPQLLEVYPDQFQIDASSAFRMEPDWFLSLPEINGIGDKPSQRLYAGSNCTTAGLVLALGPLHKKFTLENFRVSTYQAASGAGQKGLDDLEAEEAGEVPKHGKFDPHGLRHNVLPCIALARQDLGYTWEELKTRLETNKILNADIRSSATAVRIGIPRAHSEAISIQLKDKVTLDDILEVWQTCPWLVIKNDINNHLYPTPKSVTGKCIVEVGRLRIDTAEEDDGCHFCCFISFDQLLVGAAYNLVNILRLLIDPTDKLHPPKQAILA